MGSIKIKKQPNLKVKKFNGNKEITHYLPKHNIMYIVIIEN